MAVIKQVLAAADGPELVGRIEELLLATTEAAIEQVRDGSAALDVAARRRFDLIVTEFPLPGLDDVAAFLEYLREPASSSRQSALVVVTGSRDRREIESLGSAALAGVDLCTSSRQALRAVSRRLRLCDRFEARLRVSLEGATECFSGRQLAETHNISPSGMLLSVEYLLPVGMVAPIAIELPGERQLVHGSAEVVRHTDPERERVVGMGMRFVRLLGDGGERLTDFVHEADPSFRPPPATANEAPRRAG